MRKTIQFHISAGDDDDLSVELTDEHCGFERGGEPVRPPPVILLSVSKDVLWHSSRATIGVSPKTLEAVLAWYKQESGTL